MDRGIAAELEEMERRLSAVESVPATTLEILGQASHEPSWEAMLVYFLDKDKPHGFDTTVLRAFLRAAASNEETALSEYGDDLEEIQVRSQVPTGTGPVDILLVLEKQWFVCIEMKVGAAETGDQTIRYADANVLGDVIVDDYGESRDYIYLASGSAQSPKSTEFVELSWRAVVDELETVLDTGHGRYPAKSTAQLADFIDTIKRELNMDEFDSISEETALYAEYSSTINRVVEQFEKDRDRILAAIVSGFFDRSVCNRDEWMVNQRPSTYVNLSKPGWDQLEGGVIIEYEPSVELDREQPEIRLRLDVEHGDKQPVRDELLRRLEGEPIQALTEMGWEVTDSTYEFIGKSISFDFEDPQASIREAIDDLHAFRDIVESHVEQVVENRT